jgi:hypothetical protein
MASLPGMFREQSKQRELLELILRNQHALMDFFIIRCGMDDAPQLVIMKEATRQWLDTEAETHLDVKT